ncbi:hillarin isoform X2 [Zootermopsis nevadensis]|uniref:hillarin isoform X2 n=1 Tax=Zootermopsis nevadensis TaxID=136037 RepID=UPI000B8ED541|nr:hillarin isoform X2 [Zootermopsis nevadensis]
MATRRTCLLSVFIDISCVLLLGVFALLLYILDQPFHRGFFCDDDSIRYPVPAYQTVSGLLVGIVGLGVPVLVVVVMETVQLGITQPSKLVLFGWTPYLWMVQCYTYVGAFLFGAGMEHVTVEVAKRLVGRLRPHFLAACVPLGLNCNFISHNYITDYICLGNDDLIKEARMSFPSGHSSLSFYAATFTIMYLQIRMAWQSSKHLKHLLQFLAMMAAWATALTRVSDYMHHWSDVLAGIAIGTFFGILTDKDEQTQLEMKHRKEEDDLYRKFARQREEEDKRMREEFRDEWEKELERLTSRFQRELQNKKKRPDEQKVLTLRHQQEREDLEKNMTIRRDKKKESLTRKLLEHERAATAALVEKQSREMLELINEKRSEYMMAESLYLDEGDGYTEDVLLPYPSQAPIPAPPALSKFEVYNDPVEFADIDQIAISVAQEDQKTFTDLVRQLVGRCGSDIEKARTIFRWITVKNLNTMQFDENLRGDTPMGLLRGIKHGTESYHVLFKRLCSYAGLHCVVIKGYSKSAGYQPGVRFEDNRFRNSWNAVYVAGAWRFVQCNWGARHLVNAKEVPKAGSKGKSDSLRYEYDDHYFLTDPREFIYEFFPLQSEWQLLKNPITLQDFEELPFVRSLFFRYGLYFPDSNTKAVMFTDSTGAATVRIAMPAHMQSSLIFHYNLKFYDSDGDGFDGVSLKRFVMQSVVGNTVAFRVHAPCSGAFLLDIFANAVTPKEYLTGEPMKFKSVCKFKIACEELQTVMVPLPDCASGEWGPTKATRLFGLVPITHQDALVFAGRELELQFRMSRPLTDFMATLHKNGVEEKRLSKFVSHSVSDDDVVTFVISFPEEGQYGLDIYTRELGGSQSDGSSEKHLLTHCCKYLINSSKRN